MASDIDADVVRVHAADVVVLRRVELHADVVATVAAERRGGNGGGGEDEDEAVAGADDGEFEFGGECSGGGE